MEKEGKDFPAHDPSKEEGSSSVCITTPILEAILTGRVSDWMCKALDELSEILIFSRQIRELEQKYSDQPLVLDEIRKRLARDVWLHVVSHDSFDELRRYTEWSVIQLSEDKPFQEQWRFAGLFLKASMESRVFLASVSLSYPKTLFTHDSLTGDLARLLGYESRVIEL